MRLVLRGMALSAGGSRLNEDRAGVACNVAWIIDGATQLQDTTCLPAASDGTWLADLVSAEIYRQCQPAYQGSVNELFALLIARVKGALHDACPTRSSIPPACSIGLALLNADTGELELGTLGDVSIFYRVGETVARLHDARFLQNELGTTAASPRQARSLEAIAERRRHYINDPSGGMVLSTNLLAASKGPREMIRFEQPGDIVMATDGATRMIDTYHVLPSDDEFFAAVMSRGPWGVVSLLRRHELSAGDSQYRKAKDDAAVLQVGVC